MGGEGCKEIPGEGRYFHMFVQIYTQSLNVKYDLIRTLLCWTRRKKDMNSS